MSAVARWSFPIASIAVACLGALVMPACGSSPDLVDRSAAAASTAVPAARAPDASADASKDDAGDDAKIHIKTIANRADLISGGDALVEIALSKAKLASSLRVQLNGRDVSSAFAVRGNGRILGLVSGLVNGNNVLVASTSKSHAASLAITNHPIGGPVIAGPQTAPFVCATPTAQPATATLAASNASGLSTSAVDVQCNIATETFLFYRTTAACTGVLPDPSPVTATSPTAAGSCFKRFTPGQTPADLAFTTTDQGVTVPYIVRVERGTIDRGIFDIAVLFTPGEAWTPFAPQRQWNRKVVHTFGASTGQPRRQFRTEQNWADDAALSRGFMVVDNSMTDSLFDANRVYNAEVVMMMKEHIIETYGEIRYTMGNGCSGGSIQQVTAASIFPGLLDGIQPTCTYPDSETTGMEVTDCVLLVNFFNSAAFANSNVGLTQAQINAKKTAIAGHLDQTACWGWNNTFGSNGKPGNFVPSLVLNGVTGPMADPDALTIAYTTGIVSAGQLGKTPIIDIRGFDEVTPDLGAGRVGLFGIHQIWRSFALRARLDNANGTHGNHVLWRFPTNLLAPAGFTLRSFLTMDEWLANIEKDKSNVSRAQKVLNDKPADAFDFCVLSTDPGLADPAVANKVTDFGVCDTDPRLVRHHSPRQVAGGPDAENILKCQLKPLDFGDPAFGGVTFSADQQARLRSAFPNGVCDWSKPGVNQAPFIGPLTFQDGPGGKILGPAPQSGRCDFAKNGRCVPHDEDDDD